MTFKYSVRVYIENENNTLAYQIDVMELPNPVGKGDSIVLHEKIEDIDILGYPLGIVKGLHHHLLPDAEQNITTLELTLPARSRDVESYLMKNYRQVSRIYRKHE
jgi:hypothetical protein